MPLIFVCVRCKAFFLFLPHVALDAKLPWYARILESIFWCPTFCSTPFLILFIAISLLHFISNTVIPTKIKVLRSLELDEQNILFFGIKMHMSPFYKTFAFRFGLKLIIKQLVVFRSHKYNILFTLAGLVIFISPAKWKIRFLKQVFGFKLIFSH